MVIIFSTVKTEEELVSDERPDNAVIDKIIGIIVLVAAILVLLGVTADGCLDRILVNVSNDGQELRTAVDRPAFEAGLEERADPLIFFVVPIHETGDDTLKNPG